KPKALSKVIKSEKAMFASERPPRTDVRTARCFLLATSGYRCTSRVRITLRISRALPTHLQWHFIHTASAACGCYTCRFNPALRLESISLFTNTCLKHRRVYPKIAGRNARHFEFSTLAISHFQREHHRLFIHEAPENRV